MESGVKNSAISCFHVASQWSIYGHKWNKCKVWKKTRFKLIAITFTAKPTVAVNQYLGSSEPIVRFRWGLALSIEKFFFVFSPQVSPGVKKGVSRIDIWVATYILKRKTFSKFGFISAPPKLEDDEDLSTRTGAWGQFDKTLRIRKLWPLFVISSFLEPKMAL